MDIFENAVYPFTCGQRKRMIFVNADVGTVYVRMLNVDF